MYKGFSKGVLSSCRGWGNKGLEKGMMRTPKKYGADLTIPGNESTPRLIKKLKVI